MPSEPHPEGPLNHSRGRVAGKVAIVTGAGSQGHGIGNGRAAAVLLAREGASVLLIDVAPDPLAETAAMILDEGGACQTMVGDVSDEQTCRAAADFAVGQWGRLDILVNNVGVAGPKGTAVEVDPVAWDRLMQLNVGTMMLMSKFAIPAMISSGGGAIVNLSSVAGLTGGHPDLAYPTSKGAIVGLTRAMAAHHGPQGIRVNSVAPGVVYTPMVAASGMSEQLRNERVRSTALQVEGTGWDVGYAVLFLASDEARWVTGVVLPVDAGVTAVRLQPVAEHPSTIVPEQTRR